MLLPEKLVKFWVCRVLFWHVGSNLTSPEERWHICHDDSCLKFGAQHIENWIYNHMNLSNFLKIAAHTHTQLAAGGTWCCKLAGFSERANTLRDQIKKKKKRSDMSDPRGGQDPFFRHFFF